MVLYPELCSAEERACRQETQRERVSRETRVATGLKGSSFWATDCKIRSFEKWEKAQKREP